MFWLETLQLVNGLAYIPALNRSQRLASAFSLSSHRRANKIRNTDLGASAEGFNKRPMSPGP